MASPTQKQLPETENSRNKGNPRPGHDLPRDVCLSGKKYGVRITASRRTYYFGSFHTVEEAEAVANEMREGLHESFARQTPPTP